MNKILWLASWYPNPYEPFNGDFIQRHAESVAMFLPVDVIHVLQIGSTKKIVRSETIIKNKPNLTEYIYLPAFDPLGVAFIDKVRYNLMYMRRYKKILQEYIQKNGKPALTHVHVPMKAGIIARYLLKNFRIPYLVSEHASFYEIAAPDNFFMRSTFFRRNTRKIFQQAVAVTNVSETIGKEIQELFNIESIRTIHNVVDTSIFNYEAKGPSKTFRFLHVSSLAPQKNAVGIMSSLSLLKKITSDWECVICGPASKELVELATDEGLEKEIYFTGEISYDAVAAEMKKADVFILFSDHENFPCVIAEALCCGLPVISSKVGGVQEAINETNGFLISRRDVTQLKEKLYEFLSGKYFFDRESISRHAITKYNKAAIGKQFLELYNSLLGEKINRGSGKQ
jgi:glycosyltransferase involved in cell wall biosynthesis